MLALNLASVCLKAYEKLAERGGEWRLFVCLLVSSIVRVAEVCLSSIIGVAGWLFIVSVHLLLFLLLGWME